MRVLVESILPCRPELAWNEVQTSRLLLEVCSPLVTIHAVPGEQLPERWPAGQTLRVQSYLFGIIPLGTRAISFERIDASAMEIQSRESDGLVQRWDHLVSVKEAENGHCRYTDEIIVEAGWLTPVVWLFAQCLYRHRQRRWQRVAERLQAKE